MADFFDSGKFGAIVPISFYVQNVTTGASNADMSYPFDNASMVMPVSGSVIGISVKGSANTTAGSATFKAHNASTEYADVGAPVPVINATNSNATYATVRPGVLKFVAGDVIGVSVTTTTTLDPTNTNDFSAVLWVQLNAV